MSAPLPVNPPPPSAPLFFRYSPRTQLILHSALSSAELFSAIAPPAFLISSLVLRKQRFSVRRLMYASIGGTSLGAGLGAGYGFVRGVGAGDGEVMARLEGVAMDAAQVRRNDYATICAAISALLTPAIFLRRARLPVLVLGGASAGLGAGAWGYVMQRWTKGKDTGLQLGEGKRV
ncbi:hypothetical protein IAT38_001069 [Cryptococcus sp. DSM 104549]